jgi:GNAT superfamily N-acetyltransferase
MNDLSKVYEEEDDGFNGNVDAYHIETKEENLKNWLEAEVNDNGDLYKIIKKLTKDILIIKNINVDEEFQGQGFGGEILCNVINDSYTSSAILLCDIGESQRDGFLLEEFYKENGFETILKRDDYPLMVFPQELALEIKSAIENKNNKNLKYK